MISRARAYTHDAALVVFAAQAIAKYRFLMRGRFFRDKKNLAHVGVIALQALDVALYVALTLAGFHPVQGR